MGNQASLILAGFVLPLCICACLPTPRANLGAPAPDQDSLLAYVQERRDEITDFRGIGKLSLKVNGERQTTRVAWIGSQPGDLRVETLGPWGQPNVTFLLKGSTFHLHAHRENRCLKGKATARNLSRFVSMPVRAEDLFVILSGQVPVVPYHYARMWYSKGEDRWCLCLYKKRRRLVERMWLKGTENTICRVEVFDGRGGLQYMASFKRFQDVGGVVIAHKIILSDEQGDVLSLDVETFWTGVEIPAEAYTLQVSCGSGGGS